MKSIFVVAILLAIPILSFAQEERLEERIVYIRNGVPFTMWFKTTQPKLQPSNQPAPCMKEIVVRLEHGQQLRALNPGYQACVTAQEKVQDEKAAVRAQERGGDDDIP